MSFLSPPTPRIGVALLLSCGTLGLVACGSSDSTTGTNASATSTSRAERDAQRIRLQQCLRKEGIDVPEPGSGGGRGALRRLQGADRDKLQEALQGPCKSLAQNAFGNRTEAERQEFQDRFQKFRQCMKDEGVDIPDFEPGNGPPPIGRGGFDPDDPDFQEAAKACEDVAPRRPGGGGPGDAAPGTSQ